MTYQEMCEFDVLYKAYLEARKRKRSKAATAHYEANALACTEKLARILYTKTYVPSKFETFYVYEPKKRLVQAPAFVDKVVLHAVTDNIMYDALTRGFIRDNCASQKGKGTHDCLERLRFFMQEYYRKNGTADGWVLKCDVHHFFASIDHDRLKEKLWSIIQKRGVDPQIYELLCTYIDTTEGLPLGYQTSQLLALSFLDEFDHMIKEKYRVRYYGRYMDDFYMISPDKKFLQRLLLDVQKWMECAGLELNRKTGIYPLRNGVEFLGFHTYLTDTGKVVRKLRRDSIQRVKAKIKRWKEEFPKGEITKEEIIDSFRAWDAHASHGDTYSLRSKYAKQVGEIVGEEIRPRRKTTSSKQVKALRRMKQEKRKYKQGNQTSAETGVFYAPRPADIPPWEEEQTIWRSDYGKCST